MKALPRSIFFFGLLIATSGILALGQLGVNGQEDAEPDSSRSATVIRRSDLEEITGKMSNGNANNVGLSESDPEDLGPALDGPNVCTKQEK